MATLLETEFVIQVSSPEAHLYMGLMTCPLMSPPA